MITRRHFLSRAASYGALGTAAGFASNLSAFNAFAANTDDYRALVCVFFYGGLDGHDVVIPYDLASYNKWADIRAPLLAMRDAYPGGSRYRENLLPLAGINQGGQEFALPLDLKPLHELFTDGKAAIVGNVGPLIEPITRSQFLYGGSRVPQRLFSHNDQQSTWVSHSPEGAQYGWGGRLADQAQASGANPGSAFTAISAFGDNVFLTGKHTRQFNISTQGPLTVDAIEKAYYIANPDIPPLIENHLRDLNGSVSNLFQQDIVDLARFSLDANAELSTALANTSSPMGYPEDNNLAAQLSIVAQIIAQNEALNIRRQIFLVGMGGFDTHDDQPYTMPALQNGFATAIRAFYDSMVDIGMQDKVTTFTASDFGRTLKHNGDGTDHGWGNHHFVIGGAVNGGQLLGEIPEPEFEHDYDSGNGRLIPSTSVDQYAGELGRWFGLTESELLDALPGYSNFDANRLSGLFL